MTLVQPSHGQIANAIDSYESTPQDCVPLSPSADKGVRDTQFKQARTDALHRFLC